MLDAKGLEAAARKLRNAEKEKFGSWPDADDSKSIAAATVTAYLQAVGPEPAVDYHGLLDDAAFWIEGALKCKEWNWSPDQFDAASDCLSSIRSALVATPPAERVVEVAAQYAERLANVLWEKHYRNAAPNWKPLTGDLIGIITQIDNMTSGLALATKPAVKDDETVVALRNRVDRWKHNGDKARISVPLGELRAALAAKDGRS